MKKHYIAEVVDFEGAIVGTHIMKVWFFVSIFNSYTLMRQSVTKNYSINHDIINFRRIY